MLSPLSLINKLIVLYSPPTAWNRLFHFLTQPPLALIPCGVKGETNTYNQIVGHEQELGELLLLLLLSGGKLITVCHIVENTPSAIDKQAGNTVKRYKQYI